MGQVEVKDLQYIPSERLMRKDGFYITYDLPGSLAATAGDYGVIFICRHPMEVLRVAEVHSTASSVVGTLDVEKLTGTTAPGSGTSILATTFNLQSTANTVVNKENTGLSSARQFLENERLALKTTGVLTLLAGVQVTIYCKFLGRGDYR